MIKKNFMAPFYGWGSTVSRLEPLRGGSLLFANGGWFLLRFNATLDSGCKF